MRKTSRSPFDLYAYPNYSFDYDKTASERFVKEPENDADPGGSGMRKRVTEKEPAISYEHLKLIILSVAASFRFHCLAKDEVK